jgi:spore coat protein U-like protein
MRLGRNIALACVMLAAASRDASAAQLIVPFEARVTIITACAVSSTNLNFGNVGIITGTQTATATVSVECSSGTPYALSFSGSSTVTAYTGQMTNSGNNVTYTATLVGPNASVGTATHTILGSIPLQPTPPSAIYTDNRTIFLDY